MSNAVKIGDYGLVIPGELWFDVATLKIDLRPALEYLVAASPSVKTKIGRPKKNQRNMFSNTAVYQRGYQAGYHKGIRSAPKESV